LVEQKKPSTPLKKVNQKPQGLLSRLSTTEHLFAKSAGYQGESWCRRFFNCLPQNLTFSQLLKLSYVISLSERGSRFSLVLKPVQTGFVHLVQKC
jgi:hypothetical protein